MKTDHLPRKNDVQRPVQKSRTFRRGALVIALSLLLLTSMACSFSVDFSRGNLSVNSGGSSSTAGVDAPATQNIPTLTDEPNLEESTETSTPPPKLTQTPTPESVIVGIVHDTFCRTGPSGNYEEMGSLNTDQSAQAIARDPGETSWLFVNPDNESEECWIWGRYATPQGSSKSLPIFTPPPSPTPRFDYAIKHIWVEDPVRNKHGINFTIINTGGVNLGSIKIVVDSLHADAVNYAQEQTTKITYTGFGDAGDPNNPKSRSA